MTINDFIIQIEEIYSGNPWYGDSFTKILSKVNSENTLKKITTMVIQ
jgi:hypothetical protein